MKGKRQYSLCQVVLRPNSQAGRYNGCMAYREDLARRLKQVPFTLATIAREAGVSREWVSKARNAKAHTVTPETAQRIGEAIDRLTALALASGEVSRQHHPGVEGLAENGDLMRRHHVSDAEISWLRSLVTPEPIRTEQAAVMFVIALRFDE